jgi:hypothetical protein
MKDGPGQVAIVLADRATGERTIFFRRPPSYTMRPEEITGRPSLRDASST